jgi:Ca2+-binding EF-hand superfamily protein
MLLDHLDKDKSGHIDFNEFLSGIRGQLSVSRLEVVQAAFAKYDPKNTGYVFIENLRGEYNCELHPKVVAGKISPLMAF